MKFDFKEICQHDVRVFNFPIEAIPELVAKSKKRCLIVVEDTSFLDVISLNISWECNKILIIPPKDLSIAVSPVGFKSHYDESVKLFNVVADSLWHNVKGIVVSQSNKNLYLPVKKHSGLTVDNSVDYNGLHAFLCDNEYRCVDVVQNFGDFVVRGAIIDFFPHTSKMPIRCTFFDKTLIYLFDVGLQTTVKEIKCIDVPSLLMENKKKLYNVSSSSWNVFCYDNNILSNGSPLVNIDFKYNILLYNDYLKNKDSYKKQFFLVFDGLVGFVDSDSVAFIPRWFKEKVSVKSYSPYKNISLNEFEVGDYLVHRDCGVGSFVGVSGGDGSQDFIIIKYQDGRVLVDVHDLHKISFYCSLVDGAIEVDSLNKRNKWIRRRDGVRNKLDVFVKELYELYNTKNALSRGVDYSCDIEVESQFINAFKYEETVDQGVVWDEISSDLASGNIMDRLLCGDVGFGKTELAIRAAFRVVFGGGRVLVLAPTTILTKQLYEDFNDRLEPFGIRVDYLSRMKKIKHKNLVELNWVEGRLDVLIGTHIILNNSIFLKNSNLLIIDEEHRFGVKQKELVRFYKNNIDLLSMSATPIPRTLNMAMSGFKSISTLSSPPCNRKPIITQVVWFNEVFLKTIIVQEFSRGGQVFFVNNYIPALNAYYDIIMSLMPFLRVKIVHGKMKPSDIDLIMSSFVNREVDVLITTSIIESGLDISSANTIIINNAHNFGLSQLYQMRGRVGRSSSQAFCYLMLPKGVDLNKNAHKRLKSIERNTHLGAGYNISNMDLEIRGGGSVFGYRQSGGASVGFELYSSLLNDVVNDSGCVNYKLFHSVSFKSYLHGFLSDKYIDDSLLRLFFYRRLNAVVDRGDVYLIKDEVVNRFGPLPSEGELLFDEFFIRVFSASLFLDSVDIKMDCLWVGFCLDFWGPLGDRLIKFVKDYIASVGGSYKFVNKSDSCLVGLFVDSGKLAYCDVLSFLDELCKIV